VTFSPGKPVVISSAMASLLSDSESADDRVEHRFECAKEEEFRRSAMQWRYWGEAQMLPCPFCGKKTERARLQMVMGGGGDMMSALMGMAAAYDTSGILGFKWLKLATPHRRVRFQNKGVVGI